LVTTSTTVSSSEFGLISTKKTSKRAKKIVKEIRRITVCQNGSH
jgi:ribosomal protein L37AE/L43A